MRTLDYNQLEVVSGGSVGSGTPSTAASNCSNSVVGGIIGGVVAGMAGFNPLTMLLGAAGGALSGYIGSSDCRAMENRGGGGAVPGQVKVVMIY